MVRRLARPTMPTHRAPNVFAGPYVDRSSGLRKDPAWLAAALADGNSRFVPIWRQRSLLRLEPVPAAVLLPASALGPFGDSDVVLLGLFHGVACFAIEVHSESPPLPGTEYADLRTSGALLAPDEAGLLAYARAMLYWRQRHRHCGACGAPTRAESGGHVMTCSSADCATQSFPRIDPAMIVLVSDGERALLGRQASWPAGRYSTIAGFVEPGESLEDAVAREVREETSVEVDEVEYHSSQPWPFPSSLMVGFHARATTLEISCPDGELEDARWFLPDELASGTPALPPPQSISFRLIADWYRRMTGRELAEEPGARLWPRTR
jgi:NAD+ diphosphatase